MLSVDIICIQQQLQSVDSSKLKTEKIISLCSNYRLFFNVVEDETCLFFTCFDVAQ